MSETRITSETGGQKGVKEARFDLIPPDFLEEVAKVYGFGEKKYPDVNGWPNWRNGYDWRFTYGALHRHISAFWQGEDVDPESGKHHLAHAAWHLATLFVFSTHDFGPYKEFDTRPLPEVEALKEAVTKYVGGPGDFLHID